ncbi:hypothetical protein HDV00_003977, partial [Rhizophlyctis rosea]
MPSVMPEITPYYPRLFKRILLRVGEPIDLEGHPIWESLKGLEDDKARSKITAFVEEEMKRLWAEGAGGVKGVGRLKTGAGRG